jgi:hypothetical protein
MLHQVDDALPHTMSGIELSRVRTELRLLPPEAYQQKSDRVERGRHCYAIKWPPQLFSLSREVRRSALKLSSCSCVSSLDAAANMGSFV